MRFVDYVVPDSTLGRLALSVAVQITAVTLAATLVAHGLLKRHAAARHAVWLIALIWVLLSPVVATVVSRTGLMLVEFSIPRETHAHPVAVETDVAPTPVDAPVLPVSLPESPPSQSEEQRVVEDEPHPLLEERNQATAVVDAAQSAAPQPRHHDRAQNSSDHTNEHPRPRDLAVALPWVWGTGALMGIGLIGAGWWRLTALRRTARPLDVARYGDTLSTVRNALGIAELPEVATSPAAAGPAALGLIRPLIVLPEWLPEALTPRELRDVLVHECAHLLRHDPWVGLLQRLAAALFWPHPLIHFLNTQLTRAREEVCDNHVLRTADACGYARTLLALTERCRSRAGQAAGIGLLGKRWTLVERVSGLLDPRRTTMTRTSLVPTALVAAGLTAIGLMSAGTHFAPLVQAQERAAGAAAAPAPPAHGQQIKGIVVDAAGRPVAGALVKPVRTDKAPTGATTGADGSFSLTLRGFMLLKEELVAEADSGNLMGFGQFEEPRDARPAAPVRIVLKPSRSVTVLVRDATGAPVAGAAIEAVDYGFRAQAASGPDGSAALRIPADAKVRWVIAHKAKVGFNYYENYRASHDWNLGPIPDKVTVTLNGAKTVRVTAVDSAGHPVAGVQLTPWVIGVPGKLDEANIGGSATVERLTDAQGVATFDWIPKDLERGISFLVAPGPYSCPDSPLYEPAGAADLTARLLRKTKLRGTARFADGRPAARLLIQAEGRGASNHYARTYARTGEDGSYAIEVDAEQSYIVAVIDETWAARSHTAVVVHEGQSPTGVDFRLIKGTIIKGRISQGMTQTSRHGFDISLVQEGNPLPKEFHRPRYGGGNEGLVRFTTTNAEGRYRFRVGPGKYELLMGPSLTHREKLTVTEEASAEIVRDLSLTEPAPPALVRGVVLEKNPAGTRPVPDADVEALLGGRGKDFVTRTDARGRFQAEGSGAALILYARSADGKLAGFTKTASDAADVTAFVANAARVSGRVVDTTGQPQPGRRVQLRLDSGPDQATAGHLIRQLRTDEQGRFVFDGAVVGTSGEVVVSSDSRGERFGGTVVVERFVVRGEDPVELPDIRVAKAVAAPEPPRAAAAAKTNAMRSVPAGPSRTEIEDLVRAIGRDAVTAQLVDRVALEFRQQVLWARDFARARQRATDPEFVQRVDALSATVGVGPTDTLTLIQRAAGYHVGYDDLALASSLRRDLAARQGPSVTIRGTIVDEQTDRPVPGARVFTGDAIVRTDELGRFTLHSGMPREPRAGSFRTLWVEADGYALREASADVMKPAELEIKLRREVPFEGKVVDANGRPVEGAEVRASVDRNAVVQTGASPKGGGNVLSLQVRTNAEGSFSVRGVPASKRPVHVVVRHPAYQEAQTAQAAPTASESALVIRLEPGCIVGGAVVDERGRPVPGAWVQVRRPSSLGYEDASHTDKEGRFRFQNIRPGRWDIVVEPERHAPVFAPVVADRSRPVENQFVVTPGAYIRGKVIGPDGQPVARAAVGWMESVVGEFPGLNRMTATDDNGTFRIGPLPSGKFRLTGLAESPRRLGKADADANQTDALIRLKPDPIAP